jgi:mono/diheme cytochrome c family protein
VKATLALALVALAAAGCRMDMHDQPKVQPYEKSSFFPDGRGARPLPAGTIARGRLEADTWFYEGKTATGEMVALFPAPVTRADIARGRERYDVYCSPCHDRTGGGEGMIVQRGYVKPTSFHDERLRAAPPGHFFNAATNGFGVMPSYAKQIPTADRWAIVAYVKALQLSQNALLSDVPPEDAALLDGPPAAPAAGAAEHGSSHE